MRAELRSRTKDERPIGGLDLLLALSSDDSARAMKCLLGEQMERMESMLAGIEGDFDDGGEESATSDENDGKSAKKGSVLVVERNKAALCVLRRERRR